MLTYVVKGCHYKGVYLCECAYKSINKINKYHHNELHIQFNKAYRPNAHLMQPKCQFATFIASSDNMSTDYIIVVCNVLKLCSRSLGENIFEWSYLILNVQTISAIISDNKAATATTSTYFNYTTPTQGC